MERSSRTDLPDSRTGRTGLSRILEICGTIGDLVLLNLVTVACSLPVFSFPAAYCAMFAVIRDLRRNTGDGVLKQFFLHLRADWPRASLLLLPFLPAGLILFFAFRFLSAAEGTHLAALIFLFLITFLAAGIFLHSVLLFVSFENSPVMTWTNALKVFLGRLPQGLACILLASIPLLVFLLSPYLFLWLLMPFLLFGLSAPAYAVFAIQEPVLEVLSKHDADRS